MEKKDETEVIILLGYFNASRTEVVIPQLKEEIIN